MFTKSFTSLRRFSGCALTLVLFAATNCREAAAQVMPPVTASSVRELTPPSGLGQVFQTAIDSFGDLLFVDYANGALYEYPANGGAVITLLPSGSLGGYANPGIAIGANNDLYLEGNYNNVLGRFPYDSATQSWDGLSTISAANGDASSALCPKGSGTPAAPYGFACGDTPNTSPYYFQPWAIAVDPNNNLVITSQNSGNFIFTMPVNGTGITSTAGQANSLILSASSARAQSVAEDKFGNIYFVEETDQKAPLPGVLMIPAGSTGLTSDAGLVRVDPNLPAVTGVTTDAAGNLYISDSKEGVFMVPNPSGTPETSSAVLLTPLPSDGQVSIDWKRGILYVPNNQNGQVIYAVTFNAAQLGSAAVGSSVAGSSSVYFGFNASETPASFAIEEGGAATSDFAIASGGSCAGGTKYAAYAGCSVNVTLSPHVVGNVSAKLLMLDSSGNTVAFMTLQGTGTGSAVQILPGAESTIGSGLKAPSQVAVDAAGNLYVADSGLGVVQRYAKGSSTATTVGTGLTSPTGVAVDGAGDVFIADSGSGDVVEIPNGSGGLNAAGQVTLKSGLGTNLKLAVDGLDDLYISDPANNRVVKLDALGVGISQFGQAEVDLTGFNVPSALAADDSNNLYVADGANLFEVTPTGVKSTLLTSLSNVTGLAVDPSGAVYVTSTGSTVRIPDESGTLNPADQTSVATNVTNPTSVAIDSTGDLYITDATAEDVEFVSVDASYNFGTQSNPTATASANFTILDEGNAALNITGFTGTADYSETATTCSGPVAVGATCSLTVTFNPGPGDQGTLQGEVVVQSDAANSPVGVNATGVGAALAASTTKVTVSGATVNGAPAVITVTPSSGTTPTPTGQVTLTVTGNGITPVVLNGTLAKGTVTLTPTQLPAGTYTFAVSYAGDRAYSGSTASVSVTVGAGAVTLTQPTMTQVQTANPAYPYVLAAQSGSDEPYDGSISQFETMAYYTVKIAATDGGPLIGQPVYDSTGTKVVGTNYGSVTFQGAPTPSCQPVPVQSDGTAQFDPSCFTINTSNDAIPDILTSYTVTPVYSPAGAGSGAGYTNPNYTTVTGTAISYTALRNPMVQISSSPSSLSVKAGSSTTATLTLTSLLGYGIAGQNGLLNNYSLPVQLSCDGLPAYATCSFSYPNPDPSDPNSVHVGPATGSVLSIQGATAAPCTVAQGCSGPGTVIMTITTNVPPGVASLDQSSKTVFAAMFGFGLLSFAFGKRRALRTRMMTLMCLLVCCGIIAGISGCSTKQLGTSTGTPTPAGTYTVTVTAKEVGSQVITATPGITYGNGNQMSLPFTMNVTIQ